MMSKIEWTDKTWNPIIGCNKISEGCDNCYAEKMACRLACMEYNIAAYDYRSVVNGSENIKPKKWNGKTFFAQSQLQKPLNRKKPTKYFVCSMGDLFHESVPFEWVLQVWDVMCQNPRHTYQLLTKRPERVLEYLKWLGKKCKDDGLDSIPSSSDNYLDYVSVPEFIWIGVTAENQEQANKRVPILLNIPATIRFVSCEPLLSEIDFPWYQDVQNTNETVLDDIDWVIVGGESGHHARPMHPAWAENIRNQCIASNTSFFFKQWGNKKAGCLLDGKEYKNFPEIE